MTDFQTAVPRPAPKPSPPTNPPPSLNGPTGHEVRASLATLIVDLADSIDSEALDVDAVDALARLVGALSDYNRTGIDVRRFLNERESRA